MESDAGDRWTNVDRYIDGTLVGSDDALEQALQECAAAGLPPINVSPSQGKLLHVLARGVGARRILEIGTLGGYSGIWLARALPHGGTLVTIEVNEAHARVARRNFDRAGVTPRIEMRVGRALEVLPTLVNEHQPPFDLVFIDADKTEYADYLERSIPLCRSGSLIVADNVVRNGTVVDGESPDPLVRGVRRFMAVVAGDRRVTATALQTVGVKGYDGFAVIVVV